MKIYKNDEELPEDVANVGDADEEDLIDEDPEEEEDDEPA